MGALDETINDIIKHHGIKGMRWGVRRRRSSGGTVGSTSKSTHDASPDASRAKELSTRAKTHGTHTLSNQDLQHLVSRMNLEQQYSKVAGSSRTSAGAKVAKEIMVQVGKQQITSVLIKQTAKALPKALK